MQASSQNYKHTFKINRGATWNPPLPQKKKNLNILCRLLYILKSPTIWKGFCSFYTKLIKFFNYKKGNRMVSHGSNTMQVHKWCIYLLKKISFY